MTTRDLKGWMALGLVMSLAFGAFGTAAYGAEASFSRTPASMFVEGSATKDVNITFPDNALQVGVARVQFALPEDYAANTPINITLTLNTGAGICSGFIDFDIVQRRRFGQDQINVRPALAAANGTNVVNFTAPLVVINKNYILRAATGGDAFDGHQKRDVISVRIRRNPTNASDNCAGNIFLHHLTVRYTRAAS